MQPLKTFLTLAALSSCAVFTSHASITVYNSQAAYLAAIDNPGVDTFNDLALGGLGSPIGRTAGAYTYSASSPSGLWGVGGGGDVWLSNDNSTQVISLYNFSPGVQGAGGFFFASDSPGDFLAGQTIRVVATDGDGFTSIDLLNTTLGTFLGFVTDGAFSSITLQSVAPFVWPTLNDLTLGVAVPEPGQIAMGVVLLVGAAGYVIRRRRAAR